MAKVIFVYRDNELFSSYVPKLAELLRGKNHEVHCKVFPQGTPEGDIAYDVPKADVVIPDMTCRHVTGHTGGNTLDTYFSWATQSCFKADELTDLEVVGHLVSEAVLNGAPTPREIIVVKQNITDHIPRERSIYALSQGEKEREQEEFATKVANKFQEIFPQATVLVKDRSHPGDFGPRVWIVVDRHFDDYAYARSWKDDWYKWREYMMIVPLPASSLARHLGDLDLLRARDGEEFLRHLEKSILNWIR